MLIGSDQLLIVFRPMYYFRQAVDRFRLVNWFRAVADGFKPMLIGSDQLPIDSDL
jgi:hypothetical protein